MLESFFKSHWPYNQKITRDTGVMRALGGRRCESCGTYDRIVQTGDAPYIDKYGAIHVKAFCGKCLCISKWRYQHGELFRK